MWVETSHFVLHNSLKSNFNLYYQQYVSLVNMHETGNSVTCNYLEIKHTSVIVYPRPLNDCHNPKAIIIMTLYTCKHTNQQSPRKLKYTLSGQANQKLFLIATTTGTILRQQPSSW